MDAHTNDRVWTCRHCETIQELIAYYKNQVFDIFWNVVCIDAETEFHRYKTIWSEQTDDISWSEMAKDLIHSVCPHCAKKFVEEYGENEGEDRGEGEGEDSFYKRLLHHILFSNGIAFSFQDYETYMEANPFVGSDSEEDD